MSFSRTTRRLALFFVLGVALLSGCGGEAPDGPEAGGALKAVAAESFLADIAQNVSGERFVVRPLIPQGADPHTFEPAPRDMAQVAAADLLIVNGGGLEEGLLTTLENAAGQTTVVEASAGLRSRDTESVDPHYWLDPVLVESYVGNIRNAFSEADPQGASAYEANAARYVRELRALDAWIARQVARIPPERRVLVTNHESAGYFADRYGFTVVGTVIPSVGAGDTPSAQQLSGLTRVIRASGVRAIFVERDADPRIAQQIAAETGIQIVAELLDHSLTPRGGDAPTYIAMMKHNATVIVKALR